MILGLFIFLFTLMIGEMGGHLNILLLFLISHLLQYSSSHPYCSNSRSPSKLEAALKFCSFNGRAFCDESEDEKLQKQFQALNISDTACTSLFKSILCARCDQYSAKLFQTDSGFRTFPNLCNTTLPVHLQQSTEGHAQDFCTKVWETCGNVSIIDSPFEPFLQDRATKELGSFSSKLKDVWQSKRSFCDTFGGSSDDGKVCFNGEPISFESVEIPHAPQGLCLEKIGDGSYLSMVPHPDGSNRAFLSNLEGKIWLATIPDEGSNNIMVAVESKPFLDISDEVLFDSGHGLMGIAFHPKFAQNGRFFVSYTCDQKRHTRCAGRCACNSAVNCDPSKLASDNSLLPCEYHAVVAEFTVNGTASNPSLAESANPSEVRRIFTIGLPYSEGHSGQILFGPADGYLYLMMADGSNHDDPLNFAQNKRSLLGKILRIDVENIPSSKEISDQGLWGNYSIPKDNPYINDKELEPEIWALGLREPWRCSFDSKRPSYFLCGDTGQDQYEEIDVVIKGCNYGWRVYEGPYLFHPSEATAANTPASSIDPIFPVLGYSHHEIDKESGSASIIGGYFYRSMTDPCMYGRYLYTDLYSGPIFVGTESPEGSRNFTCTKIPSTCAYDSPMECAFVEGSPTPSLGYVFSLAEDNRKDIYYLASNGVYRVARPSRCKYSCAKENDVALEQKKSHSSSPYLDSDFLLLLLFVTLYFLL